ncbi:hypothetical protein D3C80_1662590 [compost metagenome]
MSCANHRPQTIFRVEWITHLPISQVNLNTPQQIVLDIGMNDQARGCRAVFAHVPEGAIHHVLRNKIDVFDIVHHNCGIFTSALQNDTLQV